MVEVFERQDESLYRKLERLYGSARCNTHYQPRLMVDHARAEVVIRADPKFHHAAHAVHGSVYFKLLDDAAFFAANSLVPDVFVLTASFHVDLMRPVADGIMRAVGDVVQATQTRVVASSMLYDEQGRLIGQGTGSFMRSNIRLDDLIARLDDE